MIKQCAWWLEYICDLRTVAVLVQDGKILVQRERNGNEYALPGGYVKIGETLEDGLIREMRYIALRSVNSEIRQNYYFFAKVDNEAQISLNSNEGKLQWFDLSEINSLEMPYTAKYVLQHYCAVGINNSQLYCGVADGKQVVFTELPEY